MTADLAARNNAEWCHTFCRTHGVTGEFRADAWSSSVRTPPYYPDAVTLIPDLEVAGLLRRVDAGEGCSIKDSFARLDLAGAGFTPLIHAEWVVLLRPPVATRGWSAVASADELRRWEEAWGETPGGGEFFRAALLRDETVSVLARHEKACIVAGAIANRSADAIGLTNVFDVGGDLASAWAGGAAAASQIWGELPTVGYDAGDALTAAHDAGFESVGELVVWMKAS